MIVDPSEDLWNTYKELKGFIWKYLNQHGRAELPVVDFENVLRRHKSTFFALLQNPVKNVTHREEIKKGMVDGINVKGIGHQVLSKELYQETIILSDMFEMDELVALDLLCTAQIQMPYYPGLPRGLVAVLLYYDGRKALVTALLYLIQARSGIQWSVNIRDELLRFIMDYTNQLMEGGIFTRIFELLRTLDLSKEIELLQENLALGGPKHRRQITDLFNDIRNILADIVFSWSTQCGLPKDPTLALINYLKDVKIDFEATGVIDNVNLYLEMALLSALDLSILHSREDGDEAVQLLPILIDRDYVDTIVNEFLPTKPKWASEGLQSLSTFGMSICLASLRMLPQSHMYQEAINREDSLADTAIEMNVFRFIYNVFLESEIIYKEEFLYKRFHHLLTDFIVYMFPKVKELRMKANEVSRTLQVYLREGLDAPANLPRYYDYLLRSIAKFYSKNILENDYILGWWSTSEVTPNYSITSRSPTRAVSLFKFVRFSGDMLPPTLFVPFLKMLSGLSNSPQTSRQCFNMLKQTGVHLSQSLSWDHFFTSLIQYYNNLRQETPAQIDTVYRNRGVYPKGVNPQELEGLHAVLFLIRTIAENDHFSRLAICEHPEGSPLSILLGLVSCSVPIPLKADLLLTLASLSKSSENASQMWELLESSQILVTIPSTSSYSSRGIETELEEIESRLEEYALTKAFLKLLDTLTDYGIPRTLGAGPRKPGFDPYLSFIVNSVFLKCQSRSYRDPEEKWEVTSLCLNLFEKFLTQYDPNVYDFPRNEATECNSPPGYHLMVNLNNRTEMLNIILDIIDEGSRCFDTYVPFPGQGKVEICTLACLNIIYKVLILQPKFSSALAMSTTSQIITGINKLLVTINRKSGKPDHCINIAKYVTYQQFLPRHSLVAVKILADITNSAIGHGQFMNILLSTVDSQQLIKNGFFECLDSISDDKDTMNSTKKEILRLLKQCLNYVAPNFTHFLLGFDLKRDISKMEFQYPGVMNFPRSCLHSLISLLDSVMLTVIESPPTDVVESGYHLLYILAANPKTSAPILRFLRLNKSFFKNHLMQNMQRLEQKINSQSHQIKQILSWLMKTLAIELKMTSNTKQLTYLKQLMNFLINTQSSTETVEGKDQEDQDNVFSLVEADEIKYKLVNPENVVKMNNFIINFTDHFEFDLPSIETPDWEFFNNSALNEILTQCQSKTSLKLIDLKKLHQNLFDELKSLQGTAAIGQIQAINQEIPKVLRHALNLNKRIEARGIMLEFVDSWRQVAEVLVSFLPLEVLDIVEQQVLSISLLLSLINKATKTQLLPEVARLLSGSSLLMIDNIKRHCIAEQKYKKLNLMTQRSEFDVMKYYYSSLKYILEGLVKWIITSDVVDSELRTNLYASLLTFLQLISVEPEHEGIDTNNDSLFVSRLNGSLYGVDAIDKQLKFSTEILSNFGEKLMDVLCHDCIGGQEICKILAMSCYSQLMIMTGNMKWVVYLSGGGYLRHIIQSIMDSDKDLKAILEPGVENIKPLYLYLAKMLLLTKLASSKLGVEMILEQKLLGVFSNMSVFGYHPEISKFQQEENHLDDFLPSPEQQYLQTFMPTLEICNAILTTMGTENQSAISQIMYYLFSNLNVVELILRSGSPDLSQISLKELALLTSVISRTANNDLANVLDNPNIIHSNRAHLYRIQRLMLALLPHFVLTEDTVKRMLNLISEKNSFQTSERVLYVMQIAANLLNYARNVVANYDTEHGNVGVLFYPTLTDPKLHTLHNRNANEQEPNLGIIVQQLINTVNYHHQEKATFHMLQRKMNEISDMNSTELNRYIYESVDLYDLNGKKEKVYELISDRYQKKKKEMNYCAFIIENCLYLIWCHLDYYMLRAIPKPRNGSYQASSLNVTLPSTSETTWKVSADVISNLKQGLVSLFNDTFSKQLLETSLQDRSELDKEFIEVLLRKIKRLMQFVPVE